MIARAFDEPLPPWQPTPSRTQARKAEKVARQQGHIKETADQANTSSVPKRNRITHFVMNLPDSAITFLDAFRGVLNPQNNGGRDLSGIYGLSELPMVHCYCFTKELELEKAEVDIRQVRPG